MVTDFPKDDPRGPATPWNAFWIIEGVCGCVQSSFNVKWFSPWFSKAWNKRQLSWDLPIQMLRRNKRHLSMEWLHILVISDALGICTSMSIQVYLLNSGSIYDVGRLLKQFETLHFLVYPPSLIWLQSPQGWGTFFIPSLSPKHVLLLPVVTPEAKSMRLLSSVQGSLWSDNCLFPARHMSPAEM